VKGLPLRVIAHDEEDEMLLEGNTAVVYGGPEERSTAPSPAPSRAKVRESSSRSAGLRDDRSRNLRCESKQGPTGRNLVAPVTVRYFVDDVEVAVDFYCKNLGFRVELPGAPGFAGLARDDLRLLLHEPGAGGAGRAGGTPAPGGLNRFQLPVDDLAATVARLEARGVAFRGEIVEGPGGTQVLVEDPSGNPVEIFQPRAK
jgi:catechol 2,3-dioxygenase-like lactoylglutathione lyase family enzyme